jgi:hypothetical protein
MFYVSLIITGLLAMLVIEVVRDVARRPPRVKEDLRTQLPTDTTP